MILDGLQELIEMGVGVVSGAEHLFGITYLNNLPAIYLSIYL